MSEEKLTYNASAASTWEEALDCYYFDVMRPLMVARHKKYGPKNILAHGELGLKVRIDDKRARIDHAAGDFADESVSDAWIDMGNYAGPIRWMLVNGYWELPMEGEALEDELIVALEYALEETNYPQDPTCTCGFVRGPDPRNHYDKCPVYVAYQNAPQVADLGAHH